MSHPTKAGHPLPQNLRIIAATLLIVLLIGCGQGINLPFIGSTPLPSAEPDTAPMPEPEEGVIIEPTGDATPLIRTATPAPTTEEDAADAPEATATPQSNVTPTPQQYEPAEDAAIQAFEVTPNQIGPGDSVTVTWEAEGDSAELCYVEPDGDSSCSDVPMDGSGAINFGDGIRTVAEIPFTLTVKVGDANEIATITAVVICPDNWFFSPAIPGCPAAPPLRSFATAEHFEQGMMIWVEQQSLIYVFYEDDETYDVFDDPYRTEMPRTDPAIIPPSGFFQPELGFGKVWRGEVEPELDFDMRERLGWALEPEFGYDTIYQCQAALALENPTCYLRGPDGGVIELDGR
jgi:hypothetical protein